jgi:dTDP-4-amino-4,6-dideoxygalactose transaminase
LYEFEAINKAPISHGGIERIANWYPGKYFRVTESGRSALELALLELRLAADDEVWIETTSNNFYISGCVTNAIEKHCKWSRSFSERTKAILINHEFGFPAEDVEKYTGYGVPIIEDCAFSFLSQNSSATVGKFSDYLIASFPKFLPVPWGGALYSRQPLAPAGFPGKAELLQLLDYYAAQVDMFKELRLRNYIRLEAAFSKHGFSTRFDLKVHHIPGVFMFRTPMTSGVAQEFKAHLNGEGIQSSVFYGESAYFIPCHHEMNELDVDYLAQKTLLILREFCDNG